MSVDWARGRRNGASWIRSLAANEEPWSSLATLGVALVAVVVVGTQADLIGSGPNRPSAPWLAGCAGLLILALWAVSLRFSRRTLRLLALLLLVLFATVVLNLGRTAVKDHRAADATAVVARLNAELDTLKGPTGGGKARTDAAEAVAKLRKQVQDAGRESPTAALGPVLDALDKVLADSEGVGKTLAEANERLKILASDAARIEPADRPLSEAIAAAQGAAAKVDVASRANGDSQRVARDSVDALSDAIKGADPSKVPLSLSLARRDVARAVAADSSDDKSAQETAAKAHVAYLAELEKPAEPTPTSLADAFSAAGRELLDSVPLHDGEVPFTLGAVGWIVLAGLALIGYRALEGRTGRRELFLGKVETFPTGSDDATKHPTSSERFRTYLSRNIPEPAAVPDASSTLKPVTDLLDAATAIVPATWVGRIVKGVVEALKAPRGATATLAVLGDGEAVKGSKDTPKAMVTVRLTPPAARVQLQETFVRATLDEAMRAGAYWAAATLMVGSRRVPGWALWSPDACDALAQYYAAVDTGNTPSVSSIEVAVASAPRSGLLLVELANRYAINDQLVEAFEMVLRAVTLHRRWPVARYRLAVTAIMLANDNAARWRSADVAQRAAIVAALRHSGLTRGSDLAAALEAPGAGDEQRRQLCEFGISLLDPHKSVAPWRIMWRALRPTERSYWLSLFRTRENVTYRTQFEELAKSGKLLGQLRQPSADAELDLWTDDDDLTWQRVYNRACAYAERAAHPTAATDQAAVIAGALDLLELAITRPGGHQLTREWLEHDPDLAILRSEPRFERLAKLVPRTRKQ